MCDSHILARHSKFRVLRGTPLATVQNPPPEGEPLDQSSSGNRPRPRSRFLFEGAARPTLNTDRPWDLRDQDVAGARAGG